MILTEPAIRAQFGRKLRVRTLADFVMQAAAAAGLRGEVSVLLTGDEQIRELNRAWRRKNKPTDVLSFPAPPEAGYLGEIAISTERAHDQAAQFNHPLLSELQILMLHGFLHLTGMDHERDRGQMARAERKWRGEFNLPATLIARSKQVKQ